MICTDRPSGRDPDHYRHGFARKSKSRRNYQWLELRSSYIQRCGSGTAPATAHFRSPQDLPEVWARVQSEVPNLWEVLADIRFARMLLLGPDGDRSLQDGQVSGEPSEVGSRRIVSFKQTKVCTDR